MHAEGAEGTRRAAAFVQVCVGRVGHHPTMVHVVVMLGQHEPHRLENAHPPIMHAPTPHPLSQCEE